MSTTVYGTAQYDESEGFYTRVGCTYDITSTDDSKTFSGTLFWQHKGPAKTDRPYISTTMFAILRDNSILMGQTIVETNGLKTIAKHTNWTTMESKSFSVTYNRLTSARQIKITGSVYDWFPSNELEILIDIPPLPSWDVTYDGNGGTNVPAAQTKYKDIDLVLKSSKPSRTNYNFYHWNTQPNNSGTTYEPGATYTDNAALALYAIWNAQVRYNMNGGVAPPGSGLAGTQKKTYGVNLTLLTAVPTRTGYVFNGWNTAADGTGTAFQPGGTYSAEIAVTLYAQWLSLPAKPVISSMTAIRWNETTDQQDDTGTSAKVTAGWNIDTTSEYYGNTNTGTVTLTVTPQSGSSSHTITPISGTSGASGTAVFMVSGLDTDMQYTCKVTVTDLNASSERSVILTRAFFIMDFKAGGGGIGIGRAAPDSGLEIGYETIFDQDVTVYEDLIVSGNVVSPKMTGTPTAPTPSSGDDSTKVATTAFVKNAIGGGGSSHGIPSGGSDGQILTKQSGTDYDVDWEDPSSGIPSGGSDGQILTKQSGTDYDVDWEDPSSVTSTDVPTADTIAEFDSDAHMNSTDMTSQEVEDFIDGLNVSGNNKESATATKVGSYYSSGTITAYKCCGCVTVKLDGLALSTLSARTTVATLPAGFRPAVEVYSIIHGTTRGILVTSNGNVQIESGSSGTYWASITYSAWN